MTRVPDFLPQGFAFVDIETTGGSAQRESITEIGIIEVDAAGLRKWSSLVRPEMRIPRYIERLTGITNEMVARAPPFADLAEALFDRLEGRLFVAHNARFDHGYLRAAFRRVGMDIGPQALCTVRLSRRLFPEHRRHSLDHLIERHGLEPSGRHRALADADLLLQFWHKLHERFTAVRIDQMIRELLGEPTLPTHLSACEIEALPDGPGVYLFFGDNDLPLYVGKSNHLRRRVLSHFHTGHASDRQLALSQEVRRIEWRQTSGDLGALLQEALLVKRLQPLHNRRLRRHRELWSWRLAFDLFGDGRLELVCADDLAFGPEDRLYGLFRSRRDAIGRLRALAREHALCPPLLGLEKPPARHRCFTFQLKHCHGACSGQESFQTHMARLMDALDRWRIEAWPYPGPIGIREGRAVHVVDRWRYLGSAEDEASIHALLRATRPPFDADVYRILVSALQEHRPVHLDALAPGNSPLPSPGSCPQSVGIAL